MYNRNTWLQENTEPSVTLAVYTVYSNEMNLRCTYFCHLRILNNFSKCQSIRLIWKSENTAHQSIWTFFFFGAFQSNVPLASESVCVVELQQCSWWFPQRWKELCVCCRHTNQHCPDWPLIRCKLSTFSGWAVPGTCTLVPQAHSMMYLLTVRPGSL